MPSIIADLGHIVEKHLIEIGLLRKSEPSKERKQFIEGKARRI